MAFIAGLCGVAVEDQQHGTTSSQRLSSFFATRPVIETGYRAPQLTLWTLGPDEWLLFKKLPDYMVRQKRKRVEVFQLSL